MLDELGVLSLSDTDALSILADTYTMYADAQAKLSELDSLLVYDAKGRPREHPLLKTVRALRRDLWSALAKWGLTPETRDRVAPIGLDPASNPEDQAWNQLDDKERRN
jgi:P27 family predicted phage terminase small subunit